MLAKRSRDKMEQESLLKDALQVSFVVTAEGRPILRQIYA